MTSRRELIGIYTRKVYNKSYLSFTGVDENVNNIFKYQEMSWTCD